MYKRIFKAFLVSNTYLSNKYVGIMDTWQSTLDLDTGQCPYLLKIAVY